jgi:chromosomal replication initiator protein
MSKKLVIDTLFPSPEKTIVKKPIERQVFSSELDIEAVAYWDKCLDIIRDNVSTQVFKTWFEPIQAVRWKDSKLHVKVPSQFYCEWIEEHYYPLLQKSVFQIMGENASLQYEIVVDENNETIDSRTIKLPAFKYPPARQNVTPFIQSNPVQEDFPTFLNPRYAFDNFIRGESNQLACSASVAVSQNPGGTRFNPLVIYGETGLGKTHLVQGIGNYIVQKNHKSRVIYTTSERFTMEYINAIQNNKINDFIAFYRSIDVLIVDDIQFFGGKEKTQDNFFHTFNALHQAGKQIVLTSDKAPRDLADVDERLISRFQWGLTTDIQAPDFETRMAILQRKSCDEGIDLPQDVLEYIAYNVTHSIRELEGILIGIIAKVTLDRRELNLDLAREVVSGTARLDPAPITIHYIRQIVAEYYNLSTELIESKSRKHEIALARQMAIYISKELTQSSLKNIGSYFGNRDHSTIMHSCQTIENYIITDKAIKSDYDKLLKKIKSE